MLFRFLVGLIPVTSLQGPMSETPMLRNQWSAATLLSAMKAMDADADLEAIAGIEGLLPDDPCELAEMCEVG